MAVGWVKIIDGKIVARELGLVVDGYERKLRKELDDAEECRWPFINGIRQDPWKPTTYLPMRNDEDGGLVVYGPFSDSGRGAIKYFVSVVRRSDRGGKDPQVLLESRKFTNQHGGVNYAPVFKIVGWDYWDGQPALEVQPIAVPIAPAAPAKTALAKPERSDMDDEVPF